MELTMRINNIQDRAPSFQANVVIHKGGLSPRAVRIAQRAAIVLRGDNRVDTYCIQKYIPEASTSVSLDGSTQTDYSFLRPDNLISITAEQNRPATSIVEKAIRFFDPIKKGSNNLVDDSHLTESLLLDRAEVAFRNLN